MLQPSRTPSESRFILFLNCIDQTYTNLHGFDAVPLMRLAENRCRSGTLSLEMDRRMYTIAGAMVIDFPGAKDEQKAQTIVKPLKETITGAYNVFLLYSSALLLFLNYACR